MNWRKIGKGLLFPPAPALAALVLAAAAALVYGFIALEEGDIRRIPCYVLSFYALAVVCLRAPGGIAWVKNFRRRNRHLRRYAEDVQWRMNISLLAACLANGAYATLQLVLGVVNQSGWFCAMAGYYALLAGLRLMLGRHLHSHQPGEQRRAEWKQYRLCGGGLLLLNGVLAVFLMYYARRLRVVRQHEIVVISMAAYTFAALTMAIINVLRYRKYASPACSAAKVLSLASACVSMLSLENVMLTTFAKAPQPDFHRLMMTLSGAGVSVFMLGMAVYMIASGHRNLKREASAL